MSSINQHLLDNLLNAEQELSSEAIELIKSFIRSQMHEDGGFIDRSGNTDPYYSVFGYTLCYVFNIEIDYSKNMRFLNNWQTQHSPDFVHAVSIIRCLYLLDILKHTQKYKSIAKRIDKYELVRNFISYHIAQKIRKKHKQLLRLITEYKTTNEGFNHLEKQAQHASVYANFLAYGLFEDLHFNKTWRKKIALSCIDRQLENGSFVNHTKSKHGISSTTAAGIILLNTLNYPTKLATDWLCGLITINGGILAGEQVPITDLLSTATALFALNFVGSATPEIINKTKEYASLHWDSKGGFFGSIADQIPDIEYTFYGLLALGQKIK